VGRPFGSKWCITFTDDDIEAGEEGTVVGFLEEQRKVRVHFNRGIWRIAKDNLITFMAWQEREAVGCCFPSRNAPVFSPL
jgi:hypothetical protein